MIPTELAIAHVGAFYPGLPLVSLAWPTRDHWMPWRLVTVLYDQLRHVLALQRLTLSQGTATGAAMVFGEKGKTTGLLADNLNEAYPGA